MRHSSISVGNEEQVVMAGQATSTATAGTGLLVLHIEFMALDWQVHPGRPKMSAP